VGDPRIELITARHVLSHTSGFQNWRSGREPLRIHFRPGERWLYSGEGYYYLQSVLTQLTGHADPTTCGKYEGDLRVCATDIDEYLESHLLHPFGMTSSGYVWNTLFEARATRTHDAAGTPLPPRRPTAVDAARYASSGGLWTTPADYARFLIAIIRPKQADSFRLKKEMIEEMVRTVVKVPDDSRGSSWALGWQVFQAECGTVLAHGGDGAGSHALAYASREHESGLVIMTNGAAGWKLLSKLTQGTAVDRLLTA
jgi:CubicO group peptidase (beta-lactamase class C family)